MRLHRGHFTPVAALTPARLSLSFFDSATSTGANITIPVGSPEASVAILVDVARGIGTPSDVNPNGNWTQIFTLAGTLASTAHRISVWYRILDADDEGDIITGMDSTEEDKVMLVFQGTKPITAVAAQDVTHELTDGNPALQLCNANAGAAPLIIIGIAYARDGGAVFNAATETFDGEVVNGDNDLRVGYKIFNGDPQNWDIDMDDINSNILASFYLEIA